jgi:hypothetical protein
MLKDYGKYYTDYMKRYYYDDASQQKGFYTRTLVKAVDIAKSAGRNIVRVLDIGSGDFSLLPAWLSEPTILLPPHKVEIQITAIDPFYELDVQASLGEIAINVKPVYLNLREWLDLADSESPPAYDLITSWHGLYTTLEKIQASPQRACFENEYTKVFSTLLQMLTPEGAFFFHHSSRLSLEKIIKFDPQYRLSLQLTKKSQDWLKQFDNTDAESLLRLLSPRYLVNEETVGGVVTIEDTLGDPSFAGFAKLFLRIPESKSQDKFSGELIEALFNSWKSLSHRKQLTYLSNTPDGNAAVIRLPLLMKYVEAFPTFKAAHAWGNVGAVKSSLAAAEPLPLASREYYLQRTDALLRSIHSALRLPTVLNGTVNVGTASDKDAIIDVIDEQVSNAEQCLRIGDLESPDAATNQGNTAYVPMTVLYPLVHQAQYYGDLASLYPRMLDSTRLHSSLCRPFSIEDSPDAQHDIITQCPMVFQPEDLLGDDEFFRLMVKHREALRAAWKQAAVMATVHLSIKGLQDCLYDSHQLLRRKFEEVAPERRSELYEAWKIFNNIFYYDPHFESEDIFYYYLFVRRNVGRQLLAVGHWSTQINRPSALFLIFDVEKRIKGEELELGVEALSRLGTFVETASLRSGEYEAAMRSARAAIMSRNLSHNVGSHTLANPRLYKSLDMAHEGNDTARRRLGLFHSYTQGRLDFMARAMSGSNERPEPLFFLGDVLNGFFRQGVLLDTLVEDNGYPAEELEFRVEMFGDRNEVVVAIFEWNGNEHRYAASDNLLEDVQVGIPGGAIGCHALYAILENCLRNAVKYGVNKNAERKLSVTLRLGKCKAPRGQYETKGYKWEDAWILRISDNVSADKDRVDSDFVVTNELRQHINTPLIRDEEGGKLTPYGHGIQEMKVCAETLAGGEGGLRFPADEESILEEHTQSCKVCAEYQDFRQVANTFTPPIITRQGLRCYSHTPDDKEDRFLIYNLLLPCSILLGVVTPNLPPMNGRPRDFVHHFNDLTSLAKTGAHFGVILDKGGDDVIEETLKDVARLHPSLPFRLMVVTPRPGDWRELLEKQGEGGFARAVNEPFTYPTHIPNRRLRIIAASDDNPHSREMLKLLEEEVNPADFDYLGTQGWESIALIVYDAWLRAYKMLPDGADSWKLCIGFEHGGSDLASKWERLQEHFSKTTVPAPCISIHVVAYDRPVKEGGKPMLKFSPNSVFYTEGKEGLTRLQAAEQKAKSLSKKQILAFDNHGEIFPDISKPEVPLSASARFHQKMGLKESLTLFQTLESPPLSCFSFAWFIYSLAECALTKVAIVDERVAQVTLGDPEKPTLAQGLMFKLRERQYHKAGLFPLLTFRRRLVKGTHYEFISKRIEEAANKTLAARAEEALEAKKDTVRKEWDALWRVDDPEKIPEGLTLTDTECQMGVAMIEDKILKVEPLHDADVIVIHEGVTDIMEKGGLWKPHGEEIWLLYSAAPCVVRTSGRGREARHLRDFVPFLEFTELSENTYRNLNKYALCKALLGTIGDPDDLPASE